MKVIVIEIKNLLIEKYVNKTETHLKAIIISLQKSDSWKLQLTITINFISSEDTNDVMTYDNPDEIIEKFLRN